MFKFIRSIFTSKPVNNILIGRRLTHGVTIRLQKSVNDAPSTGRVIEFPQDMDFSGGEAIANTSMIKEAMVIATRRGVQFREGDWWLATTKQVSNGHCTYVAFTPTLNGPCKFQTVRLAIKEDQKKVGPIFTLGSN